MKVIANRVLVLLPKDTAEKKYGGIIIPEMAAKDQFPESTVIEVGPKVVDVKKGDTVIIDRYSGVGHRVTIKGIEHILFTESDILAITTK